MRSGRVFLFSPPDPTMAIPPTICASTANQCRLLGGSVATDVIEPPYTCMAQGATAEACEDGRVYYENKRTSADNVTLAMCASQRGNYTAEKVVASTTQGISIGAVLACLASGAVLVAASRSATGGGGEGGAAVVERRTLAAIALQLTLALVLYYMSSERLHALDSSTQFDVDWAVTDASFRRTPYLARIAERLRG
jgi:hypothetical protein